MTVGVLILALAAASALLGLWTYVRWPDAAPRNLSRAMLHGILAFAALQVARQGLPFVDHLSGSLAPLAVVALIVPALTYAFLAALWFMRLFAAAFKGFT